MDLATKSKNTSPFVKFIVILLSVATMFGAFQCGIKVVEYADVYGDKAFEILRGEEVVSVNTDAVIGYTYDTIYTLETMVKNGVSKITSEEIERLADEGAFDDNYYDYWYGVGNVDALQYYIIDNKTNTVLTNFKSKQNYKTVLKDKEFAFSCVSGKTSQTLRLDGNYGFVLDENVDGYFFFDVDENGLYNSVANPDDRVATSLIRAYELSALNVKLYTVFAVIFALMSVSLAIYSFTIAGKRDRNGKVKLSFIDYVPLDIHLTIVSLLVFLLVIAIINCADQTGIGRNRIYEFREWWMMAISACAAGIQLLVIEFFTSLIRNCKSSRKWYKTTLITFISYLLIKLDIILFKQAKKNREKRRAWAKEYLGYKPEAFKRRIILFLAGYGIINIFFAIMSFVWTDYSTFNSDEAPAIMNAFCWFVMNLVSVIFVSKYIINLDKIIVSAKNRSIPNVNYQKLPKSLKMLVDSMQYTNQELTNAVEKAVKDERMRTELITNVSHDLKTPLTSIINYVDLLKNCDISDENAKEYIAVLDEKGIKLKRLIEDLLEASKVTSGVITLNPVNLDLSELATEAVVEHQQEFIDNYLELVFKGDKHSVVAFADGNKTFRIIENLLSNARKYSAKGSRVYADVFEENNTAIFEIKNISAEPLDISADELKERFVRGDKSRTNEGNGLGLSIADNLCRAMNGRLELIIDGDLFKARVILPNKK